MSEYRTDKTPVKGIKPSTTPSSKVKSTGKLPHPAASKPKPC